VGESEGLAALLPRKIDYKNGLVPPPPAELVVQASGNQVNVAIVDIDRITSEGTGPGHRYALVLQPDEVVFGSRLRLG
jgi:hypothetical protein